MVRRTFSTINAFLVRFVFNFIKLLDIYFQDVIINLMSIYIVKYNKMKRGNDYVRTKEGFHVRA